MKLELLKDGESFGLFTEGGWFTLPTGEMTSPAYEGWARHGYELVAYVAPEEPDPEPEPVDLLAYTANARWLREVGGVVFGAYSIATDDRSKLLILGARAAAVADAGFTTKFKLNSGAFVDLDAAAIIAIADAVLDHVAEGFAIEATVAAQITGETITTTAEIDAAFNLAP